MGKIFQIFERARKEGRNYLLEPEAKTICSEYGIPVTKFSVAKNFEEAAQFAEETGYPVVLHLKSSKEVKDAYNKILANVKKYKPDAKIVGVLVQEMAPPSTEVIVGATKDPQFGPALMFGFGGIFVEILKDVAFRIGSNNQIIGSGDDH